MVGNGRRDAEDEVGWSLSAVFALGLWAIPWHAEMAPVMTRTKRERVSARARNGDVHLGSDLLLVWVPILLRTVEVRWEV